MTVQLKFYQWSLSLLLVSILSAQNGSWWQPPYPFSGDTITIYFDPAQNAEIPDNVSSLVLHWGVNETGTGQWQPPSQSLWPPGTVLHSDGVGTRSPMTQESGNLWKIDIPTDLTIFTLHYVVNDGTPASPGGNWGHSTGGANWNITLFQFGLSVVIIEPEVENPFNDPLRSPFFAAADDTVRVVVAAVTNSTQLDSLSLYVEDIPIVSGTSDSLTYYFIAGNYGVGPREISVVGVDTTGISDTVSFSMMINPPVSDRLPPPGVEMGINYIDATTTTLALFAPYKAFVYVIGDFNDWRVDTTFYMQRYQPNPDSTVWWLTMSGLSTGIEYAFQYLVDGKIRVADPYTDKLLDPWNDQYIPADTYPDLKPYPEGKTNEPVSVLQTAQQPFNWVYSDTFQRPDKEDLVIYELLVRDYIARHDFQTLKDTLDYLKNLGINAIEVMPFNEFEWNSSWGYNTSFYFAPDKYYGTKQALKTFIDESHKRGIAVIMDIVLNHSYSQSPMVRLYWDPQNNRPAADNPWYNQVSPNPVYAWGYDFNHESVHTRAFVDRVNRYWLTEYRVDGFRFDFTKGFTNTPGAGGGYDPARIAILSRMADRIWEVDSTAYVILEHFANNSEERQLAEYQQGMMLWGNSSYNYNEATMGYHSNSKSDFSWGYYGTRNWNKPNLVTYMESHDEERLMYKNLQWGNSSDTYDITELGTALNRIKLAAAFFLTLPGPKMIWQFGELGYDVSIDDPCRVCEKPILWNYFYQEERNKLYKTYAALNKLRSENEVFRSAETQADLWLGNSSGLKRIRLSHPSMSVAIIGNFGVSSQSISPNFYHTGWWYDYFSGDSMMVTDTGQQISLAAGEFHIYTDTRVEPPELGLLELGTRSNSIPYALALSQNYPNPFNPVTRIDYSLQEEGVMFLSVYDLLGREVKRLAGGVKPAGRYSVFWNGKNNDGETVASGVYFYTLKIENHTLLNKLLLMK